MQSIVNIGLRGITLLGKFLLVFMLAKELSPSDYGLYGLVTTSVIFLSFFIGVDFYNFSNRELLNNKSLGTKNVLVNQALLHIVFFIFTMPIVFLMSYFGLFPLSYFWIFCGLLLFEEFNQELYRINIMFSQTFIANTALLIRSSLWAYIIFPLFWFEFVEFNLPFILKVWLISSLVSLIISIVPLIDKIREENEKLSLNVFWVIKGLKISFPFLLSTLALKFIEFFDRYLLKIFHGVETVGAYTFYLNITNVIQAFIFAGVLSIYYPLLIKNYNKQEITVYERNKNKMIKITLLATLSCGIILSISMDFILNFINNPFYTDYKNIGYVLIIAVSINVISLVPHYILYSRHLDKFIYKSTFYTFFISIVTNLLLIPPFGVYGASICLALSMTILLLSKLYFLKKSS
jgi:O-antigen/teichoic acid export membrane protein